MYSTATDEAPYASTVFFDWLQVFKRHMGLPCRTEDDFRTSHHLLDIADMTLALSSPAFNFKAPPPHETRLTSLADLGFLEGVTLRTRASEASEH